MGEIEGRDEEERRGVIEGRDRKRVGWKEKEGKRHRGRNRGKERVHPGLYPKVDFFTFSLATWHGTLLKTTHAAGLAWLCPTWPV